MFKYYHESHADLNFPLHELWSFLVNSNPTMIDERVESWSFDGEIKTGSIIKYKIKNRKQPLPIEITEFIPYHRISYDVMIPLFRQCCSIKLVRISPEKTSLRISGQLTSFFVPFMKTYCSKKFEESFSNFLTAINQEMEKKIFPKSNKTLPYSYMQPHDVRNVINEKIFSIKADSIEVYNVNDITINQDNDSIPLRIYTPDTSDESEYLPIILLIHGGAWVAGNLDTHDNMARYLCKEVKALVVSVGYLNSPEGKFPIPLEQCYEALLWIVKNARNYRADPHRLAVIGDSAGGNMAAALCLLARDRKGPLIDLQVLINPSPDLTGKGTLQPQNDDLDPIRWYASQYVNDPNDVNNPYVSPVLAQNLNQLPAAVVILAEKDELRMAGQNYANRLISAGIPTNVYIQWKVGHLAGNCARASNTARESLDIAVAALRGSFFRGIFNE